MFPHYDHLRSPRARQHTAHGLWRGWPSRRISVSIAEKHEGDDFFFVISLVPAVASRVLAPGSAYGPDVSNCAMLTGGVVVEYPLLSDVLDRTDLRYR
jgi:hypothetical protein